MRLRPVWIVPLVIAAALTALLVVGGLLKPGWSSGGGRGEPSLPKDDALAVDPRPVGSSITLPELADEFDLPAVLERFWCETASVSGALHSLRVFGRGARIPAGTDFHDAPLLEVLLSEEKSRAFFGGEPVPRQYTLRSSVPLHFARVEGAQRRAGGSP